MNSVISIARHEFRKLFISLFGWTILASVQFILAVFFYLLLSKYLESGSVFAGRGLTAVVVTGMLQIAGVVMLVISPFITMRSFSDEYRNGTIKLLFSSPVSIVALVMGKFIGLMLFYFCLLILICLMPLSLTSGTVLDFGLLFSGISGVFLLFSSVFFFCSNWSVYIKLKQLSCAGCD
ncbi:MAG: ABC transporter permease subunit [Gammaproteobacteria bacterium]|nr:ABC transporter permease subunit [Gammaproteobacteria bacterium]